MIQMFVYRVGEGSSSKNKESKEESGSNTKEYVGIWLSGRDRPERIEDIPSEVFGRRGSQYALTAGIEGEFAMFSDTNMALLMYVIVEKSPENPGVCVLYPFSQPAYPDRFLDVKDIADRLMRYATRKYSDYPLAAAEYISGFAKVQSEVDSAKERLYRSFRLLHPRGPKV